MGAVRSTQFTDGASPAWGTPSLPRVCVVNLGCKVNRVESDWIESAFSDAGAALVPQEAADVVVVNTCGVTGEAQGKTRKAIRHVAEQPLRPLVAATGCVANLFPDELAALAPNVHVYADKTTLVREVLEAWERMDRPVPAMSERPTFLDGAACEGERAADPSHDAGDFQHGPRHAAFRSRRGIKVQDGCDNRCTYCIVWKARGPVRSEPIDTIERQVCQVLREGADEVVLSGINLGRFCARDARGTTVDLAGLVDRVCALGPGSVRISSVEPPDLTRSVADAMARHPHQVAPHLHLPLQAGSDTVLARMGRRYTASDFAATVAMVREALPAASLSTDVIVGFPGETDEEFAETLAFCRAMAFSKIHTFRYSARPGTPAAAMEGQVEPAVAKARSAKLHALASELRTRDAAARVGAVENVLVEYVDPDGAARGTTASYHDAVLPAGSHGLRGPGLLRCVFMGIDQQGRLVGSRAL